MISLEELPNKIREASLNAYDRGLHDGAIAVISMMQDEERLELSRLQRLFLQKLREKLAEDKAKLP